MSARPKSQGAEGTPIADLVEQARLIEAALEEAIGSIRGVGKVRTSHCYHQVLKMCTPRT